MYPRTRDPDAAPHLAITEAAVQGLIRRAGDAVGGVVMGRTNLVGDLSTPGALIRLEATCSIRYGLSIERTTRQIRARIVAAVAEQTEISVGAVDILVDDIYADGSSRS